MESIRTLLVDDSPIFLNITIDFLQQHGDVAIVGAATGGKEGLALAQALQPQVILLDLCMLNLPGLEAIPHLRQMLPEAGIIVLTLHNIDAYRQAALAAGADDFVAKATMSADLLPAIRRIWDDRGEGG